MLNPTQILQMMRNGNNPQQLINMAMQQNPQMQQMFNGVDFNNQDSMQKLCKNICLQKGLDYDTMLTQFKQNGGQL